MMNVHLADLASSQVQSGHHTVVVLNGAGWHKTGGDLILPPNLSLLHLPPYCYSVRFTDFLAQAFFRTEYH